MQVTAIQRIASSASNLTLSHKRRNSNHNRFSRQTLLLIASILIVLSTITTPATAAGAANKITEITHSESEVLIRITSAKRFPARAMRPLLHIGDKTFRKSMPAPGGSVNDLVFVIPADEYAELEDGEAISVGYEGDHPNQKRWEFGAFEK